MDIPRDTRFELKKLKTLRWFPGFHLQLLHALSLGCVSTGFLQITVDCSHYVKGACKYVSVFSPNARKYGPEKLRTRTLFTQ